MPTRRGADTLFLHVSHSRLAHQRRGPLAPDRLRLLLRRSRQPESAITVAALAVGLAHGSEQRGRCN
jgi:hypothetical protein